MKTNTPIRNLMATAFAGLFLLAGAHAQTQLGSDIDGESANDRSGSSVSMPDAFTVAIGAPGADGSSTDMGHVRVYSWDGSSWIQKGLDIDGQALNDSSGASISMPDANTIAIGAPSNDGNGTRSGNVRVFRWNGSAWVQKGLSINGDAPGDMSGTAVCMPDSNTLAISSPYSDSMGVNTGLVRVYRWNGSAWYMKGSRIFSPVGTSFYFGGSISMPDSNTIAIGCVGADGNTAAIYSWNGTSWIQKGLYLYGEWIGDRFGFSVSMPDSNTVAIGAPKYDALSTVGTDAGRVQIYTWSGSGWIQKGGDIIGEATGDWAGYSLSMPDANTVVIGAPFNDGTALDAGHIRIYSWTGTYWMQRGTDIDGEATGNRSGCAVSMPDANTVAIGAYNNSGNGSASGHVRVYTFPVVGMPDDALNHIASIYPNPTSGLFTLTFGTPVTAAQVTITNSVGQVVWSGTVDGMSAELSLPEAAGIYQVRIVTNIVDEVHTISKL